MENQLSDRHFKITSIFHRTFFFSHLGVFLKMFIFYNTNITRAQRVPYDKHALFICYGRATYVRAN